MIRADARAAGLPLSADSRDGPLTLTFHSLRGFLSELMGGAGLTARQRQELGQWSNSYLPAAYQNRPKLADLGRAAERFPTLSPAPPPTAPEAAELRATGTDGPAAACTRLTPASDSPGVRLMADEEPGPDGPPGRETLDPLGTKGVEADSGSLTASESGEGGIRTRGEVLPPRRFSKAVLSTTQPPLPNTPRCLTSNLSRPSGGDNPAPGFHPRPVAHARTKSAAWAMSRSRPARSPTSRSMNTGPA